MSNIQDSQKTLEVKIRPYPNQSLERQDLKGVSRVIVSRDVLLELKLEPGDACYLSKVTDGTRVEGIAWLTLDKNLSKKVIQISKAFQEACNFKLGDDLTIAAAEKVAEAMSVVVRDVTGGVPALGTDDRPHWEWFLRQHIGNAEVVFAGMAFKNISPFGTRRTFLVELINGQSTGLAQIGKSCLVTILSTTGSVPRITEPIPRLELAGIVGIDQALAKINDFLASFNNDTFKHPWFRTSSAVLLHGGHGAGKTYVLDKIAATRWGKSYRIDSVTKPAEIEKVFKDARSSQPSVIIIDELEDLVSKDELGSRIITKSLRKELSDLFQTQENGALQKVLVVAATLELSKIPLSLKNLSTFDTEISLPMPDPAARKAILKSLAPPINVHIRDEILSNLGDRTYAYTAKDLTKLLQSAAKHATKRVKESNLEVPDLEDFIVQDDIEQALLDVRPTAMHDITLKPPSVKWDEIGGQESVKTVLREAVETPLKYPDLMKRVGASPKKGLLLYGPPGCSKTLSAQAMATEAGFNFFAVKGAELLNMYVGESERAVRDIFARARSANPSIIFFDEVESIGSKREGKSNGINVLTTLLNEMDGIETLKGVMVLAATNQPEALDLALLRPGRFDKLLYVGPPDLAGREAIMRIRKRRMDLADDVDIPELARKTDGFSGAEMVRICDDAADSTVRKCLATGDQTLQVHMEEFITAIGHVKRQITDELIDGYKKWAAGAIGGTV